jgi:nitroreductase
MDLATADHLLTTTRSVRKRLDLAKPVDLAVVGRCLEIAFQAPTGSNAQAGTSSSSPMPTSAAVSPTCTEGPSSCMRTTPTSGRPSATTICA